MEFEGKKDPSSNLRHASTYPEHPLNKLLHNPVPPRMMMNSLFNNPDNLIIIHTAHHETDQAAYKTNDKKTILTQAVQQHLLTIPNNSVLNISPEIDKSKEDLGTALGQQIPPPNFLPPLNRSHHPSFPYLSSVPDGGAQHSTPIQLPSSTHSFGPGFSLVEPSMGDNLARLMDGGLHGDAVNQRS